MQWGDHSRSPAGFVARRHSDRRAESRDSGIRASSTASPAVDKIEPQARNETRNAALSSDRSRRRPIRSVSRSAPFDPNCKAKRCFDVLVALVALVMLLPVFAAVAIAVVIDSRGPVFFKQWRGGHNGRRFQIVKFRTMTCTEDGAHILQARRGDARVTRLGRILRKTSVDELPQLLNVLRGDMSLVGPRPHALAHDAMYSDLIRGYADRQLVRPGITGWAQVNGCRGETREVAAMERRITRDLEYIRHWSLWLDFIIMMRTVNEVVRSHSAY